MLLAILEFGLSDKIATLRIGTTTLAVLEFGLSDTIATLGYGTITLVIIKFGLSNTTPSYLRIWNHYIEVSNNQKA